MLLVWSLLLQQGYPKWKNNIWDTTATNPLLRLEAYTRENLDEKKALPQVQ